MLVRLLSFHLYSLVECFWSWFTEWFLASGGTNIVAKSLHFWLSVLSGLLFGCFMFIEPAEEQSNGF